MSRHDDNYEERAVVSASVIGDPEPPVEESVEIVNVVSIEQIKSDRKELEQQYQVWVDRLSQLQQQANEITQMQLKLVGAIAFCDNLLTRFEHKEQ